MLGQIGQMITYSDKSILFLSSPSSTSSSHKRMCHFVSPGIREPDRTQTLTQNNFELRLSVGGWAPVLIWPSKQSDGLGPEKRETVRMGSQPTNQNKSAYILVQPDTHDAICTGYSTRLLNFPKCHVALSSYRFDSDNVRSPGQNSFCCLSTLNEKQHAIILFPSIV